MVNITSLFVWNLKHYCAGDLAVFRIPLCSVVLRIPNTDFFHSYTSTLILLQAVYRVLNISSYSCGFKMADLALASFSILPNMWSGGMVYMGKQNNLCWEKNGEKWGENGPPIFFILGGPFLPSQV